MKRVLTILALLLLPLSAWAMTPVSDSDLSNVTGQAGVNINVDLTMDVSIGTMAWGDDDGLTGAYNFYGSSGQPVVAPNGNGNWSNANAGGYIGLENFHLTNLMIKARTADTYTGYNSASTTTTNRLKPLTIDVATTGSGHEYGAGITFVRIGLGSLQIDFNALDMTVGLASRTGFAGDLNQELGSVFMGPLAFWISPYSYVDIYNGGGTQGVNMTMNVRIDYLKLDTLSWGDSDGLTTASPIWYGADTGGFIGLANLTLGDPTSATPAITVCGTMRIDVSTTGSGATGGVYGTSSAVSVVRINFTDFILRVAGPIKAYVVLASDKQLTADARNLGDIYLSTFRVEMDGWVDIWAH